MIAFNAYVIPSKADVAEQLAEEPEECALVIEALVALIDEDQTAELCDALRPTRDTVEHSRKVAAFLCRLADACREAE